MDERITIYKSKRKAWRNILAGLVLLGASFLSFAYAGDDVFGWIFIIAAGLVFILGASGLSDSKPQIVLTAHGITDIYSLKEEIEWDAVQGVDDFFFRGQYFVRILLREDYKPGLILPSSFSRFNRIYGSKGLKPVYIRLTGLDINSRQLKTIIENMVNIPPALRGDYLLSVEGSF